MTSTGEILSKERMERIRNRKSKNENLIEDFETEVEEKRFSDLEKREAMEEKMINTKEVETKAVSCKICNYTAFSQSDLCKQSGHRIKVLQVKKRFFECKKCHKRTISLDKYPNKPCANCGESSWMRTGMMKEKTGPKLESEKLLIRGVEQKFIGQAVSSADLTL